MSDNQWDSWQAAIDHGTPIPTERGKPQSGYYKRNAGDGRVESIAIWRNEYGELQCVRDVYGDGSNMDADQIDELFGQVCMYPIPGDIYTAVAGGAPFPPEYATRLTMAEQRAGVMWTPELGRKKLGATTLLAENERAVIGDNSSKAGPHELLTARINDLADQRRAWLKEIGGEVTTQEHADKAADFAGAFTKLESEATEAHKVEKKPHLDAGREVDARWKPVGALAEAAKRDSKAMLTPYLRKQDEERREAARKAAAEARERQETAPAPVEPVKARAGHSGRGVTLREVTRAVITDLPALAGYLASLDNPPPDFVDACRKAAAKVMSGGVQMPGAKLETTKEAA